MTTVKASCDSCGDVDLKPGDISLVVCTRAAWSTYAFNCPSCSYEVKKPADEEVVALLVSAGVKTQRWHIPAEALENHAGPTINHDDLLDFALWLTDHQTIVSAVEPLLSLPDAAGTILPPDMRPQF